jgi:N-acetylglucosamine-6-sulfatase
MPKITAVLIVMLIVAGTLASLGFSKAQNPKRPNIIFLLSDDEDAKLHEFMPKTKALLELQGTKFNNFFVTYSLCCPSRSSILRGQYPHNTKVEGNMLPEGGFEKFLTLGLENSTVATWLQAGGYRTVFMGKYLNGYGSKGKKGDSSTHVPPGWSEWYGAIGNKPYSEYNYQLNENGKIMNYGDQPQDYLVDVLAGKAQKVIEGGANSSEPFFLYLATFVPHQPATPAPRHVQLFKDSKLPRPPSFNEADVGDKPKQIGARAVLNARQIVQLEMLYRKRMQSLQAMDDLVERVVNTLKTTGQLENTYIVYTSDNGFHLGEHRQMQGKNMPYEEDIRVPMIVRGPGIAGGKTLDQMALNNDFAPTFAEIAGIPTPALVDGRSLLNLWHGQAPATWRSSFMIERRGGTSQAQTEIGDENSSPMSFNAIRTKDHTYIEWGDGGRELYDLARDPYQIENAVTANSALVKTLSSRLAALSKCVAEECRKLEDASVGTP